MKTYFIEFYLFCNWKDLPPTYRIFLDDELITERTYIWDNKEHVLQERIPVNLDTDKANLVIQQIGQKSGHFTIRHLKTDPEGLKLKVKIV